MQIKWFKDDRALLETSRLRFLRDATNRVGLMIIKARPADAGNYKVTLTNMFGQSTSSAVLSVDGKSGAVACQCCLCSPCPRSLCQ